MRGLELRASQRREQRSRRHLGLLIVGLAIAGAGWLVAIFLLDVSDKRVEAMISLSLKVFSTIIGAGVSLAGLVLRRREARKESDTPALRTTENPPYRLLHGREFTEAESLPKYLDASFALLEDLHKTGTFVQLSTAADPQEATGSTGPKLEWLNQRQPMQQRLISQPEPVTLDELATRFRRTVLLGDPGAGKSTILSEVARRQLQLIRRAAGDDDKRPIPLPLLISLSRWRDPSQPALDFILGQMEALFGPGNFFVQDVHNQLATGGFLILLDGLNEMPNRTTSADPGDRTSTEERQSSIQAVRHAARLDPREQSLLELADRYQSCRFVVTCRSHEYYHSPEWQVVRVLEMDAEQADKFIDVHAEEKIRSHLRVELRANPTLAAIGKNPFFLNSIITAYEPGRSFASRGEVLNALILRLISREVKQAEDELTLPSLKDAGRHAYRMLRRGLVGDKAPLPRANREQEWQHLLVSTGLLVERSGERYFFHQILQEHLAAIALHTRAVRRSLKSLLPDTRWSEVVGLWRDLDDRIDKKLVRCLSARKLPWRVPGSTELPPVYNVIASPTSAAIILILLNYLIDLLLGPVHTLTWPFDLLPLSPLVVAAFLLAVRLLWSPLSPHMRLITNAAYVLGRTEYAAAIPRMIIANRRVLDQRRRTIATAIAQFGPQALPHVVRGLSSRHWRIRTGSAQALSAIAMHHPSAAADILVVAAELDDPRLGRPLLEGLVRYRTNESLRAIEAILGRSSKSPLLAPMRLRALQTAMLSPGSNSPDEQSEQFYELLNPRHSDTLRQIALPAISLLQLPQAADKMFNIAVSPREHPRVRHAAIRSLAQLNTVDGAVALLRIASDYDGLTRLAVAQLRKMDNAEVIPAISDHSSSPKPQIRSTVANLIGRRGGRAEGPILAQLASDRTAEVRLETALVLAIVDRDIAVPLLSQLAKDEDADVRQTAMDVLKQSFKEDICLALADVTLDPSSADRPELASVLGYSNDPGVVKVLRSLTGDPEPRVCRAAKRALRRIDKRAYISSGYIFRHPLGAIGSRLVAWMNLDGIRAMWRQDQLAGATGAEIGVGITSRIQSDAELAWKYQNALRVFLWMMNVGIVLLLMATLLLMRLAIIGSSFLLEYWVAALCLVILTGLVMITPVGTALSQQMAGRALTRTLTVATILVVLTAIVGALAFTWSIWLSAILLLLMVGISAYAYSCIRRSITVRRQEKVRMQLATLATHAYARSRDRLEM